MNVDISRLLGKKGSEITKLFGGESIAVDTCNGFFPIDNDTKLGDVLYALSDGRRIIPRDFVVYDLPSETAKKPGHILIAVKDGAPLKLINRETAKWASEILGYHELPGNALDLIVQKYNALQALLRQS